MTLKMIMFIIAIVFISGSLFLAVWYRMNEDDDE